MIDRIRSGKTAQPVEGVRYCVLALSGAGSRIMVRDFLEGSVLHLAEATEQWFKYLSLVTYAGCPGFPPSLKEVLEAPLSAKKRSQKYLDWVAPAGAWRQALWRAALTGGAIPESAFSRALQEHNKTVVRGELTDDTEGP